MTEITYDQRNFLIFPVTDLDKVDFSQVLETSADTVRKSIDGSKTFIKWDGTAPEFIANLSNTEGPYTYDEILNILSTAEWAQLEIV